MKFKWQWLAGGAVVGFGLLQLVRPNETNPPVNPAHDLFQASPPPAAVAAILRISCADCHSHETRWPWYSQVAPMSWVVAHDVEEGRQRLNFSEWPVADPAKAARKFGNISDVVDSGEMPPKKYTVIHRDAVLTDAQRKTLMDWAEAQAEALKPAAGK